MSRTHSPPGSRSLREIAQETVTIVERGGYQSGSGEWVDISAATAGAVAGTRLHLPTDSKPSASASGPAPVVEVTRESTLAAARRLGPGTAALVFASARRPGGGFLTGASAQEEDIARASSLHACLAAAPDFYGAHRGQADLRYSDRVIYSPKVPVFRDDAGRLLDRPYLLSMITAAAPNLRAILRNQPDRSGSVPDVVRARALRVVHLAATYGHRRLVLGAWGCGVFGNDPVVVAEAFAAALRRTGGFDHIVFAVLDRARSAPTYQSFLNVMEAQHQ